MLSLATPLRALDALHLATALDAGRRRLSPSIRACGKRPIRKGMFAAPHL